MAIDLEQLNIVITGDADKATGAIDRLISSLTGLKGVFSGMSTSVNGIASSTKGLTDALNGTTTTSARTAKALKEVDNSSASVKNNARATSHSVKAMGDSFGSADSKLSKFLQTIKRVATMRLIRWSIKQIVNTAKEGLEMLIEWDRTFGNNTSYAAKTVDELSAKWREVKKSIGAAIMPLIQILQPVVTWLLNAVISIFNALNQILRSAQGFSTYMKATAVNTQSAVSAAKELRRVLFGFDELNVLNGNGGTGAAGAVIAQDFIETGIDQESVWKRIGEWIGKAYNKLKGYWDTIKPVVEEVWSDWQQRSQGISDWLKGVYDYISEHWDEIEEGVKKVKIWLIENIELPLKKAIASFYEWMLNNHPKLAKLLGITNEKLEAIKIEIQTLTSFDNNTNELLGTPMVREDRQFNKYRVNFETDTYLSPDTKKLIDLINQGSNAVVNIAAQAIASFHASGGDPDMGTLFWAGEQGAEVVANTASGTGVMNVKQMQAAVSSGNAAVVNAIGQMTNIVVNAINNIDPNVYLDGQDITNNVVRRMNNMSRATGQPILAR